MFSGMLGAAMRLNPVVNMALGSSQPRPIQEDFVVVSGINHIALPRDSVFALKVAPPKEESGANGMTRVTAQLNLKDYDPKAMLAAATNFKFGAIGEGLQAGITAVCSEYAALVFDSKKDNGPVFEGEIPKNTLLPYIPDEPDRYRKETYTGDQCYEVAVDMTAEELAAAKKAGGVLATFNLMRLEGFDPPMGTVPALKAASSFKPPRHGKIHLAL